MSGPAERSGVGLGSFAGEGEASASWGTGLGLRCQSWHPTRCYEPATRRLYAPDGEPNPGGFYCAAHCDGITSEYAEKLGERWTSRRIDEWGREIDEDAQGVLAL